MRRKGSGACIAMLLTALQALQSVINDMHLVNIHIQPPLSSKGSPLLQNTRTLRRPLLVLSLSGPKYKMHGTMGATGVTSLDADGFIFSCVLAECKRACDLTFSHCHMLAGAR